MPGLREQFLILLGLDTTRFQRGLASIGPSVKGAVDSVKSTFNSQAIFQGFLQGAGIAQVDQIARSITDMFKESADRAKDMADSSERSLRAMQALLTLRRTPEQNLTALQRRAGVLNRESEDLRAPVQPGFFRRLLLSNTLTRSLGLRGIRKEREERSQANAAVAAEQQENYLAQEQLRRQIADQAARDAKDLETAQKNYDNAKLRRLQSEASEIEAINLAETALYQAEKAAAAETAGTKEQLQAMVLVEQRRLEVVAARAKYQTAQQRALDEELRTQQRIAEIRRNVVTAEQSLLQSRRNLDRAAADRLAFTLGEAASGERGNQAAQLTAREIQRVENLAKRYRDTGRFEIGRDQSGNEIRRDAAYFENRALQLRAGLRGLVSAEQDPLQAQRVAVIDSEKHLKEIKKQLETEKIK